MFFTIFCNMKQSRKYFIIFPLLRHTRRYTDRQYTQTGKGSETQTDSQVDRQLDRYKVNSPILQWNSTLYKTLTFVGIPKLPFTKETPGGPNSNLYLNFVHFLNI
jgi:hypothetical protein